ncbi:hypothetical protein THAOC_26215 [Thalassiosira oceanica]|uniref:Uncharacterized protein n=1 Tax=Thalassiosira oceanica TaxID=159749 RepID=K0RKI4_THAOC|nr:hypothetical protein THAOC_26215 [Thalassiosira oceanica]|eukprot:EJK54213.1 hypothetical protein THAOC_26215 [Thalassiosira oceanica]
MDCKLIGERAFSECKALRSLAIPSSVTELGTGACSGCISLVEVEFDEGIEIIGERAFYLCTALQQVTIPSSVTKLGYGAFRGCISLVEVEFDQGFEVIGESAFSEYIKLASEVQFNEGLQIIGGTAFCNCNALRQVTIPSSVTKLGNGAFHSCINLAEVQFNEGLEIIGKRAFIGCTALRSVTIPSSVTELEEHAFYDCTNLTEVILLGGDILLNHGFLDRGLSSDAGALNKERLNELIGSSPSAFLDCPLTTLKITIPRALSERVARLPQECRLSIEGRIRDLHRVELAQDDTILACFSIIRRSPGGMDVEDTDNQTAQSLHQIKR